MKPALLVIDMQNQFFEMDSTTVQSLKDAVECINATIELFRKKNLPVIAILHKDEKYKLVPGTPGFEVHKSVKILPSDIQITKTYSNAFNKTPLEEKLHELGVNTVIITGFCAEYCVLSTYRGAMDHEFTPIILRGSLASGNSEHIRFVEEINDIITYNVLKVILS